MSQLFVQDKDIVVPGEPLAQGMDYLPGPGAYRKGEAIVSNRVGLVSINGRAIKLIALSGPYLPKRDDVIICKVIDITLNGWRLDTNTPSSAMLSVRDATNTFISKGSDLTKILQIGDYIVSGVIQVTTQKLVDVTLRGPGLRKLPSGQLLKFSPNKFARIIGRQGSMVSMIKRATNCQIVVGQNGLIWMNGEPAMEVIAVEAIRLIEENAHTSGLTDRVKAFLEAKGLTVPEASGPDDQPRMAGFGNEGSFGGDRGERRFDGERRSEFASDNGGQFSPDSAPREPRRDFGSDRREGGFGGERRFGGDRSGERRFGGERRSYGSDNRSGAPARFDRDRPRFERRDDFAPANNANNSNNPTNGGENNNNNNANNEPVADNFRPSDDSQQ